MQGQLVRASAVRVPGSPQKKRLIANLVRGKMANEAITLLKFMPHDAAKDIAKVIRTAVANAEENFGMNGDDMMIKSITVDEAEIMKRRRFGSRGRAVMRRKRSSHVNVVLVEKEGME
ncbi:MAG: 50S ribosomal protein L22 [Chloroflexi bacterium]|nr:50S ribosomal protein L22 [Chloroflexota bacterium]